VYGYGLVQAHSAWLSLGGGAGDSNLLPNASFDFTCIDLSCDFDASASSDTDGSIVSFEWNFGDGSSANGVTTSHSFISSGNYNVSVTVTDDVNGSNTQTRIVSVNSSGGGEDVVAPVIANVSAVSAKGARFVISWDTDELADSEVQFGCCGIFNDSALVTSHSMSFRGTKGQLYQYWVSSTDAAGNKATAGPFSYQN